MYTLFTSLLIIVCTILVLIILIQNPKGGLNNSNINEYQIIGVNNTNKIIDRTTWILFILMILLIISLNIKF